MANHGILIQNAVAALNVDSYNRSAVCADDLDNGNVIVLASMSSTAGQSEDWTATKPATATLSGVWMVYEPEVVVTVSGTKQYKGLNPDPRDFYVIGTTVFSAYKPQIGDIITLTADALAGTKSTNTFVNAADGSYKLTWAASKGSGLAYELIDTTYISIGTGQPATQRVTAYRFQCVNL